MQELKNNKLKGERELESAPRPCLHQAYWIATYLLKMYKTGHSIRIKTLSHATVVVSGRATVEFRHEGDKCVVTTFYRSSDQFATRRVECSEDFCATVLDAIYSLVQGDTAPLEFVAQRSRT